MLAVAITLAMASTVVFGLLPTLVASFRNPIRDLKNPKPHWSWCGVRVTPRQALLVLEVGLSVVLAVTAGLYARSFARTAMVRSEYAHQDSVLLAKIQTFHLSPERGTAFYRELLRRLAAMPEVVSAAIGWYPPFFNGRGPAVIPGGDGAEVETAGNGVSPGWFETHGVRIVEGREFNDSEEDKRNSLIVNEVLAEKFWPRQNAIGRSIKWGGEQRMVVGVASENRCLAVLGDPFPCAWKPFPMGRDPGWVRIRTKGAPMNFVPTLQKLVRELHPDVGLAQEITLGDFVRQLTARYRAAAFGSTALALVAVFLVALGSVSLFASMVKDSVREIAIRMALGASHVRLTSRIVAQGLLLTLVGILLGAGGAVLAAKRVADQLYRTSATDPPTFIAVPLLVAIVGLASVYWSSRLATRTDPAKYLREQ
jgi:hypothetical protein